MPGLGGLGDQKAGHAQGDNRVGRRLASAKIHITIIDAGVTISPTTAYLLAVEQVRQAVGTRSLP